MEIHRQPNQQPTIEKNQWTPEAILAHALNRWQRFVNIDEIAGPYLEQIQNLISFHPDNPQSYTFLTDGLLHNLTLLFNAHYNTDQESIDTEVATLESRLAYMSQSAPNEWGNPGWIDFITNAKDAADKTIRV